MDRVLALYLVGAALQALHVVEELRTGFHRTYPPIIGLKPWSAEFFVTLNLAALAIFVLLGVAVGYRARLACTQALARCGDQRHSGRFAPRGRSGLTGPEKGVSSTKDRQC